MSTQSATSEIESERGTAIATATATATSTELRLGPPGSESQDPLKSSAKRGFSDVNSHSWVKAGSHHLGKQGGCGGVGPHIILNGPGSGVVDVPTGSSMAMEIKDRNHNSSAAIRASKEEVVGWPPIRSFRKNSMATNPWKSNDKADHKLEGECVYVKVSMDGAPYLRKVDLNMYGSYAELSSALEKMFSCFTIGMTLLGQYGYKGAPGRDGLRLSGSRLKDVPHSSEHCVLTYEDKDGDWMLVGDVPWDMFTNTCTRIRITKSSEAIGLAPRAMEKYKNKN